MKTILKRERELIIDLTGEGAINLPAGVLEKDIHITEALRYLAKPNDLGIDLIFCGGTSLSKAHGIIDRMSEDLDFKSTLPKDLSRTGSRKLLSHFRERLVSDFREIGFDVPKDQMVVGDEGRALVINLLYQSEFDAVASLRPEVKLEIHVRSPLLKVEEHSIATIVDETLGNRKEQFTINCISPVETLAEKILSFLKRNSYALVYPDDESWDDQLIRHIYDVLLIYRQQPNLLDVLPLGMFKQMAIADGVQYGDKYIAFVEDPRRELLKALDDFSASETAIDLYQKFVSALVYGAQPVDFEEARLVFIGLAKELIRRDF